MHPSGLRCSSLKYSRYCTPPCTRRTVGAPLCGRRAAPPGSPRRGLCAVGWISGAPRRPRCDAGLSPRAARRPLSRGSRMGVIRIRTEIPGPNSRALMKRRHAAVPRALAHSVPVFAASADGVRVIDVDENVYLDFAGRIGVMNVGHAVPSVVAAVQAQAERFSHMCFSVLPYESYVSLAERLARLSPGTFAKKTLLVNSGAEAIENAVKLARHATRRPGVLCFEDGFHGRTLLALSLTSKVAPYKLGYAPFVSDVMRVPYAYCYRCAYGAEYPSCDFACVDELEHHFKRYGDPESIAAVVVEPVLGEGGFVVPPLGYLSRLAALCRRYGILFI